MSAAASSFTTGIGALALRSATPEARAALAHICWRRLFRAVEELNVVLTNAEQESARDPNNDTLRDLVRDCEQVIDLHNASIDLLWTEMEAFCANHGLPAPEPFNGV